MLHVDHAGSVGDIINDDVLREHGFPVIEDLTFRVGRCSGEQVDNILQQLADGNRRDGSFSVSTRNAEMSADSWLVSIIRM